MWEQETIHNENTTFTLKKFLQELKKSVQPFKATKQPGTQYAYYASQQVEIKFDKFLRIVEWNVNGLPSEEQNLINI